MITATLSSDALAGEQLVVKGTLKNTGTEQTTYVLSVTGYSAWANLNRIEPISLTLNAGESKDFNVYLDVKEDATGEQFFTITSAFDATTKEQQVSVVIQGKQPFSLTGSAIAEHFRTNWFIWVIVLINIILIIAIIAVARRIASSR